MSKFKVIVDKNSIVFEGDETALAEKIFSKYAALSKQWRCVFKGAPVKLIGKSGEVLRAHHGNNISPAASTQLPRPVLGSRQTPCRQRNRGFGIRKAIVAAMAAGKHTVDEITAHTNFEKRRIKNNIFQMVSSGILLPKYERRQCTNGKRQCYDLPKNIYAA